MSYGEVSGWSPNWLPAADQFEKQRSNLLSLRGRRIEAAWVAWLDDYDEWFADLPVVLAFDNGNQLEVCWQKFDELSITWNTIKIEIRPRAWVEWQLSWTVAGHPALEQNIGCTIDELAITEHWFETTDINRPDLDPVGRWLTGGLWLRTSGAGPGLHIFNALDENGLTAAAPEESARQRVTPLAP